MFRHLVLLALLGTATAICAAEQEDEIARCAAVEDDQARLKCYDRLARPEPRIVEETVGRETRENAGARDRVQPADGEHRGRAGSERDAQEPVEDVAKAPRRRLIPRLFRRDKEAEDEKPEKNSPESVVGEVVQITELVRGNFRIGLDNGQVWRENEYEVHTTYAVGDKVTISKGFLGSHDLRNERTGQSAKVRRVD